MVGITELLEYFNASRRYEKRLEKVQEKALLHPENLFIQVRLADLLARLKKKKEAIAVYELAAQQFIQKNLFAHAIALKTIIFRLDPPKDDGEKMIILHRLYDQMLLYHENTSLAEEARTSQPASTSSQPTEKKGGGLQLDPKGISPSAPRGMIEASEKGDCFCMIPSPKSRESF